MENTAFDDEFVDGFSAAELFKANGATGLTFDDIILLPGHIDFGVDQVNLSSQFTKNYQLKTPFCSSPMDTVTEAEMAIAMALEGSVGIIHHACSVEKQASMVRQVKRFENGFILEPQLLGPEHTVADLDNLTVSGVPITKDGQPHGKLLGLVTSRDVDFVEDRTVSLASVMTPITQLVVGHHPCTLEQAYQVLCDKKRGTLPIIDVDGNLVSIVTREDLVKNRDFPNALKHKETQKLVVAAAVTFDESMNKRIDAVATAGVDILVLDSRQGDSQEQIQCVRMIKSKYPHIDVIGGNVVTSDQLKNLLEAGVDAIRVGMGAGSISTKQLVTAVGRAQLSAIYRTSLIARQYGVPVIADGGIGNSGCAIKALVMGASSVMMGSLLAGCSEAPGEYFFENGIRLKKYHGTRSHEFFSTNSLYDGFRVAQGVSGAVVDKGSIHQYIPYLTQSLKHGFQDLGIKSIQAAHHDVQQGKVRFEKRSICAQREGGVHDLYTYSKRLYG